MNRSVKTDKQFEPVSVAKHQTVVDASITHSHNYFEFILIIAGKGTHYNHGLAIPFKKGDLFFVRPNEVHSFEISEAGAVGIIRFTDTARLILKELAENSKGRAVSLAKAKSLLNHKISFTADEELVIEIFDVLLLLDRNPEKNENLFYYQLTCLVAIIERNLTYHHAEKEERITVSTLEAMVRHVHKHLRDPKMLTIEYLSQKFKIPANYIGIYFKRNMDRSLKSYINETRLEVIGQLLHTSNLSLTAITFEFGFADESHFYKSFKKFYGVSPSEYRISFTKKQPANRPYSR